MMQLQKKQNKVSRFILIISQFIISVPLYFFIGLSKAAPRFELGIKSLQPFALPLGYTAILYPDLFSI